MKARTTLLYVCFFLSGASALVYEIVWQRMLTLVFGVTTFSIAAVLAAFLAGLAFGARLFGHSADRTSAPTRFYARIELGIAFAGAASAYFIPPLMKAFVSIHAAIQPGWLGSNLIRFCLAFVAVGLPSLLIGATVPAMARLVADRVNMLGVAFGRFYAVNTLGSLCGATAAGFYLIRLFGVSHTLHFAIAGNVAAAIIATIAGRYSAQKPEAKQPPERDDVSGTSAPKITPRFVLAISAITGAAALAYEVAWMRLVAIYTLNSVYVFVMVVSVYLVALAIGAAIAAMLMRRTRWNTLPAIALIQLLIAFCVPVLLACIAQADKLEITKTDADERGIFLMEYGIAIAVVFVPAVLIGMVLPLLAGLLDRSGEGAGRLVGRLYAYNSAGTILGAATAGTLLVPLVGLRSTLLIAAAANFIVAAAVSVADGRPSRFGRAIVPSAAALYVLLIAVLPATTQFHRTINQQDEAILYYAEGPSATVHVIEAAGEHDPYRLLCVDSKSVAGTYEEIVTDQKMLAHLPLLLHPNPQLALTVGFGTGGTSYSMLQHRIHVNCVEIEPRVPDAYEFFKSENAGIVGPHHDRIDFRLILDDARAWLNVAPVSYDVIVTDVTSIQYRGNGNLYTTDYFRLMKTKLAPGGIAAAWVPASGITPAQLKVLLRSFRTAYPNTSVWYMCNLPTDFLILIGTEQPLRIDLGDMANRMAQLPVERDLSGIGLSNPYKLTACLLIADDAVERYVQGAEEHTDDHPILDYMTHATPYCNTLTANLTEMLALHEDPTDRITSWPAGATEDEARATWKRWHEAGILLMRGHAALHKPSDDRGERALEAYRAAAELIPEDALTRRLIDDLEASGSQ